MFPAITNNQQVKRRSTMTKGRQESEWCGQRINRPYMYSLRCGTFCASVMQSREVYCCRCNMLNQQKLDFNSRFYIWLTAVATGTIYDCFHFSGCFKGEKKIRITVFCDIQCIRALLACNNVSVYRFVRY